MRRRALGRRLRELREAVPLKVEDAALELDCSLAKVRHIELGRNAPSKTELKALAGLYGVGKEDLAVLEGIRVEASKTGWWSTARLPTYMQTYVGAETDAASVRAFALELIPGLLQVEEYTRALNELAGISDIDRLVDVRTRRQKRLKDDEALLELHAVISEGALRRLAAEPYAKVQLRHLLEMADRPNVTIQVLAFSAGLHLSMAGGFVLLDFDPEVSRPAAYLDYVIGGDFVDDQPVVARMAAKFTTLLELAMSPDDSVRFIREWL